MLALGCNDKRFFLFLGDIFLVNFSLCAIVPMNLNCAIF